MGKLATRIFLLARNMDNGVLDVLEIPNKTKSASSNPFGSLPSSYLTANSIALIRLKYSSSNWWEAPARLMGL